MKFNVPSPVVEVAKRIYRASQRHLQLSNTFGYETRAAESGARITAQGRILTRNVARKEDSALAVMFKNPTLALMYADIIQRGNDAIQKWTRSLLPSEPESSGAGISTVSISDNNDNGFGAAVSKFADKFLTKLGLIKAPDIQANGNFLRDHFHIESKQIARAARDLVDTRTEYAQIFAERVANKTFVGPHMPTMQKRIDALHDGEMDITGFATKNLADDGIYRFGDYRDYAISTSLAKDLHKEFGTSADTVAVDAVVAFRRAVPETNATDRVFDEPALNHALAPTPSGPKPRAFGG